MLTTGEIREEIAKLHVENDVSTDQQVGSGVSTNQILANQARILDLTSELAERQSAKLIKLTWALLWLTVSLALLSFALLVLTYELVTHS